MTAIALSERVREVVPNSGLIQSGVMIFYTTYLTWSAMTGEPNSTCQPGTMDENDTLTTVLGAMLTKHHYWDHLGTFSSSTPPHARRVPRATLCEVRGLC